ncbi:hypothetical protein [Hoeflea alexandrii]|uniref:MAE-28990/MAE-18760-like HEPN domain-containing protein n=1 Tax=Hoeflea alexandrii TaxID=288436 RepID=A0ABT1CTF9_9HYPH|nr:hypothetical protein [Hoeflea alexandrii]MCO6409482.1 hypothetical protein [Hoeflea alexandrii]MCY0152513.1 hypothetical protein [Hoeflea alexandrii]
MIEEAAQLETYLPLSYRTTKERDYVRFLWEAFDTNVEHGKYQFAFLAYHMLVMSFVYFNIWQIRLIRPGPFETAMVGFSKDVEKNLMDATSPFVFSAVNERSVLRFLKLIQCDNAKIGTYAKLVDERNDTAHANGNIFFNSEDELARKVRDVFRTVEEIQRHSAPTIGEGYKAFLIASQDAEEREYTDDAQQIEEVLVKEFYMSASDIAFCRDYDIRDVCDEIGFGAVQSLHQRLADLYPPDEAEEAA